MKINDKVFSLSLSLFLLHCRLPSLLTVCVDVMLEKVHHQAASISHLLLSPQRKREREGGRNLFASSLLHNSEHSKEPEQKTLDFLFTTYSLSRMSHTHALTFALSERRSAMRYNKEQVCCIGSECERKREEKTQENDEFEE